MSDLDENTTATVLLTLLHLHEMDGEDVQVGRVSLGAGLSFAITSRALDLLVADQLVIWVGPNKVRPSVAVVR